MGNNEREGFRGDIENKFPAYRVEGEPAEPFTVHDHEVGTVNAPGLVQEEDTGQGDIAELFAYEPPDQGCVRRKRRAEVVGLEEIDLPSFPAARTALRDQRDVARITPVQDLLDRRFTHHTREMEPFRR